MQNEAIAEDLAQPVQQSRLMWMLHALGLQTVILPVIALVAFAVVLLLILRGKGPAMVGAILLVVPMPIYVAVLSALGTIVASGAVVALADVAPKPSEVFGGLAEIFVKIQVAILLTIPVFLLAATGLTVRAIQGESATHQSALPAKVLS